MTTHTSQDEASPRDVLPEMMVGYFWILEEVSRAV